MKKSNSRRAIAGDNASDFKIINGIEAERVLQTIYVTPRANFEFDFPILPPADSLQDLSKLQHGAKCDVWTGEGGEWFMKFKKGSRILIPKAFEFNRHVAGQTPTGWEAGRYGIPDNIASQVDRATL